MISDRVLWENYLKGREDKRYTVQTEAVVWSRNLIPNSQSQFPNRYTIDVNTVPIPRTFYLSPWLRNTQLLRQKWYQTSRWSGDHVTDGCSHPAETHTISTGQLSQHGWAWASLQMFINLHKMQGSEESDSWLLKLTYLVRIKNNKIKIPTPLPDKIKSHQNVLEKRQGRKLEDWNMRSYVVMGTGQPNTVCERGLHCLKRVAEEICLWWW